MTKIYPVGDSEDDFKIIRSIGCGGSAEVFEAKSLRQGFERKHFALKKVSKFRNNGQNCTDRIKKEIEIHSQLQHPSIVKFYASFEDNEYWYIVLELCKFGSLQEYIKHRRISEKEACEIIKQVIDGMQCLHSKCIIHRDLSLKNLLLKDKNEVKIADFGLACIFSGKKRKATKVGTVNFMAPEAFDGYYDFKTDSWSIGCILYALLYGAPPFDGKTKKDIEMYIKRSTLLFPEYASEEAKELLTAMLQKEAKERIEIKEALTYKFFKKYEKYEGYPSRNGDSGLSSLSRSSSLNSPHSIQKVNDSNERYYARKNRCNEHHSNDVYHNSHLRSRDQYNSIAKVKMKKNCSSSQLTNREFKTDQELSDKKSQMLSFNIDSRCKTSTKIQEDQKYFSSNPERHVPDINSVHKSYYSQQFPISLHKRSNSCDEESKSIQKKLNPNNKSLKGKAPLTTERLKRRRMVLKHRVYSILGGKIDKQDGFCLELLKSQKYVSCVYIISPNGLQISVFRPKEEIPISEKPLIPNKDQEVEHFTFENLPEIHLKRYKQAKDFVDFLRARTPKIIVHKKIGTCVMMENTPDPNYEMNFFNGYQITEVGHVPIIKDRNGDGFEKGRNTEFILNVFENMKKTCKDTETSNSEFPVTIGSKSNVIDGIEDIKNKENVCPRMMPSSCLNGTVTAMKSFNTSKFVDSSPSYNTSLKSLPSLLPCERNIDTQCREMDEIMLDLDKCQLVGEKWIRTEYKDGIEMLISILDAKYFFQDVNTLTRFEDFQRLDLINRYHRDLPHILHHALSGHLRKEL